MIPRTAPLPDRAGAPIMVYSYRSAKGDVVPTELVMVREGTCFRDMARFRLALDDILEWAPLVTGERVTR